MLKVDSHQDSRVFQTTPNASSPELMPDYLKLTVSEMPFYTVSSSSLF